jgi:hypothetical protein
MIADYMTELNVLERVTVSLDILTLMVSLLSLRLIQERM